MAPKKRPASEIDESDKKPSYSPAFPLFPDVDLVVQSSDGILFATRALYLRAASSVFDGILGMPTKNDQEKHDGHPVLKVDEKSDLVQPFLHYAQRERPAADKKPDFPPAPTWPTVLLLSTMFDKYDAPLVAQACFRAELPRFIGNPWTYEAAKAKNIAPVQVFVVAVIHGLEDMAQRALRWHHQFWAVNSGEGIKSFSHRSSAAPEALSLGRPYGLGDLPLDLLARLPVKYIQKYCELHDKSVSTAGYSWIKVGDDFKVSTTSFLHAVTCAQELTSGHSPLLPAVNFVRPPILSQPSQTSPLNVLFPRLCADDLRHSSSPP